MKMRSIVFFYCVLMGSSLVAQDKFTNINDARSFINTKSANVSQPGTSYQQTFNFEAGKIGLVILNTTEVDAKGKSNSVQTEFFLEHIDVNRILQVSSTKELKLDVYGKGDQKLFKRIKDGKNSYINHFDVYFDDTQVARDVKDALTYLIKNSPVEKPKVSSKDEAYAWLETNVNKSFTSNGNSYELNLQVDKANNNKLTYNYTETDAKGQQKQLKYEFYMADFNGASFKVVVSQNLLGVNLNCTNNVKSVKYFEAGVQKSFIYKFDMFVDDSKLAMDIIAVLRYIKLGSFD